MTAKSIDLTALISSRICHDLSSPIGAINNGVELLGGFEASASPEMELIAQSVFSANAKLRFFRIAFGKAAEGAEMRASEMNTLCADMFKDGRFKALLKIGTDNLPRRDGKLVLLFLLCLEGTFPLGGMTTVFRDQTGWRLVAEGKRVSADPDLWGLLCDGRIFDNIGPAQVQFALAREMLNENQRDLDVEMGQTHVVLRLS